MSADSGSRELISVVVPSFNQGRWINECLHSLFAQADANLEVIVIDGGSTDSTLAVLEHWRPRLAACISEPDRGQAHAIAKGFALARGELLSWLNSDDMHLPWTIRAWRSAFSRDPSREMLHGNRIIMDASARVIGYRLLPGHSRFWLNRFPWTHQETAVWRRDLYQRVGGIDESLQFAMDYDLFARFFDAGRCAHCNEFLGVFRWHEQSKSATVQATVGAEEMRTVRQRRGVPDYARVHPLRMAMTSAVRVVTRVHTMRAHRVPKCLTATGFEVAQLWDKAPQVLRG